MKVVLKGPHPAAHAVVLGEKLPSAGVTGAEIVACDGQEAPDALARALSDADVAIAMRWQQPLPPTPKLRLLQLPGAGFDGIDFASVPRGCTVCNVHEHETGISEYVLLAMLEWTIRMGPMNAAFKGGSWDGSLSRLGRTHGEIAGKTVAILGYGHIGRAVAKRARAFDMRITAIRRFPGSDESGEIAPDAIYHIDDLDDALAQCDFLVVACPLTDATRGMIDAGRFKRMKPSAVVINVGRARVIDEEALFSALSNDTIGGAVLDVWTRYPEPGGPDVRPSPHPFHELDNVIMTPHASAWTDGLIERRWTMIATNIARLARGEALRNVL
jgi:phosphoglycerate dehydrogenase-like enzyme